MIDRYTRESGVALEINSNPLRLDMDEAHARLAAEMGIPISIDTDSHSAQQLERSVYGLSVARRAWLRADQIVTAWPQERLLSWLR